MATINTEEKKESWVKIDGSPACDRKTLQTDHRGYGIKPENMGLQMPGRQKIKRIQSWDHFERVMRPYARNGCAKPILYLRCLE